MTDSGKRTRLLGAGLLASVSFWGFWPSLCEIAEGWSLNPQYSHGYLVPVFALFLLWWRRKHVHGTALGPSWWGSPVIAAGVVMHLAGAHWYFDWLSGAALLPVVAGLILTTGGWNGLRWAWPAVAFLAFMLPLPYRVEVALAHPLQRLAVVASTYTLQTAGFRAIAEGNVIVMDDARIGVVEACNGLGMLVTFFALTTGAAMLLSRRPLADRLLFVISAIPIALVANVIRITATGALAETVGTELADLVFHYLAGLLMVPIGLFLLLIESKLLSLLVVEMPSEEPPLFDFAFAPAGAASRRDAARGSVPHDVTHKVGHR